MLVTRKALKPGQPELESNRRAHSAKLRIAEKL
jgi:16S rRNA C1402 N4-methylase RsmH